MEKTNKTKGQARTKEERRQMKRTAAMNAKLFTRRTDSHREKPDGEARSRRVQLLVKPSVFTTLQAAATNEGVSVNQICERAFLEYVQNHSEGAGR